MPTQPSTIEYLLGQLNAAASTRRMFGEYCLYYDNKVVGLVCDDQLFLKPTGKTLSFQDQTSDAPPYPGAKNYYLVAEELWSDRSWLINAVEETAAALPLPKPKKLSARTQPPDLS